MSYSVDWIAKVISVPTADLTLVSGTRYSLTMSAFRGEIRRLEADTAEGLWAPQILDHTDTKPDFAGVDYPPFDEMINGYTWQVTGAATRVDLLGSNNNLVDTLIATGVTIVPSNSAGLQLVSTGSGLSTEQDAKLTAIDGQLQNIEGVWDHNMIMRLLLGVSCGMMSGPVPGTAGTVIVRNAANTKNIMEVPVDENGYRVGPMVYDPTP